MKKPFLQEFGPHKQALEHHRDALSKIIARVKAGGGKLGVKHLEIKLPFVNKVSF